MKRYLAAITLALAATVVQAQHYHGHYPRPATPYYHHHHHNSSNWITPLIIGGVVGYTLSRPTVVYPAPIQTIPPGTPAAMLPPAPINYHYEQILDAGCNCYRWVLLPN